MPPYSVDEDERTSCPHSRPSPKVVSSDESVARILHSGNADRSGFPTEQTFQISELTPASHKPAFVENKCGDSDGVSLDRFPPATDASLRAKSAEQARDRIPLGAAVAEVAQLRALRIQEIEGQVVFVLVDGSLGRPGHAVLRLHPSLEGRKGLAKKVRQQILRLFRERLVVMDDASNSA